MVAIAYLSRDKGWPGKPPTDHSRRPLTESEVPSEFTAQVLKGCVSTGKIKIHNSG